MTADRISGLIGYSAEQAEKKLDALAAKISALAGGTGVALTLDISQAEEQIEQLHSSANEALTDIGGNQTTASALAKVYQSYEDAIDKLKALKSLSRLTYEQELAYLEAIRENMDAYGLSAKEALDLEQRLLEVQAEIAARDSQSLDTLLSGIMDALETRYETMRDAELTMLSESSEAWQEWKESSTDAIQAQIDALDELEEAEDRAAKEEEYLRDIEKLTQAIAYEQDGFNSAQLQSQLEEAQAAYADWLSGIAREDEKSALEAQLEAVSERAEAEIAALDEQADAVTAAYTQQLEEASLQAEAQQQLMSASQEELLALITAYAPDYNAAGQTLGEQLLEGFSDKVGSISDWMESLNGMIMTVQESLNTALQSASDSFYEGHEPTAAAGITITQQNTFNTPVETPSETAYRIRQANEELAAELLGN